MATTPAKAAVGSAIKMGSGGSPETFTTVASVKKITGPQMVVNTVDTTAMDDGGNKTKIATLFDGGKVGLEGNYTGGASQTAVFTAFLAKSEVNFKIVLANSLGTISFAAIIASFQPDADVTKPVDFKIDLEVTGAVTWA